MGGSIESREPAPLPKKTVPKVPDLEEVINLVSDLMEPASVLCVTSAHEAFGGLSLRNTSIVGGSLRLLASLFIFRRLLWFRLVVGDWEPLVFEKEKNCSFPLDHRFNLTDTPELTKIL